MTPPSPADRHATAFGDALASAAARADRRRTSRRRAAAGGLAVMAVAGALGAAVVLPGGQRFDPVAEARAALGSGDRIVHYRVRTIESWGPFRRSTLEDVWTTASGPLRGRIVTHHRTALQSKNGATLMPGELFGYDVLMLDDGTAVCRANERAYADRTETAYSASEQVAVKTTFPADAWAALSGGRLRSPIDVPDPAPMSAASTAPNAAARDPLATVRRVIDDGVVVDRGPGPEIDGRPTRLMTGEQRDPPDSQLKATWNLSYVVDAATWAPRKATITQSVDRTGGQGSSQTLWFEDYELLRPTEENERLLAVQIPEGATVHRTEFMSFLLPRRWSDESQERGARERQRCFREERTSGPRPSPFSGQFRDSSGYGAPLPSGGAEPTDSERER